MRPRQLFCYAAMISLLAITGSSLAESLQLPNKGIPGPIFPFPPDFERPSGPVILSGVR